MRRSRKSWTLTHVVCDREERGRGVKGRRLSIITTTIPSSHFANTNFHPSRMMRGTYVYARRGLSWRRLCRVLRGFGYMNRVETSKYVTNSLRTPGMVCHELSLSSLFSHSVDQMEKVRCFPLLACSPPAFFLVCLLVIKR